MQHIFRFLAVAGIATALAVCTSCTYQTAIQRLPPQEQVAFRAYSKVMSTRQAHTYLTKATAAERAAYLEEIGLTQRFQALSPLDRETVMSGFPRIGMSAEALRFLWGEPYSAIGPAGRHERWVYLGSAFSLAYRGNSTTDIATVVEVHLANDRVTGWLETVPTINDDNGRNDDRRR